MYYVSGHCRVTLVAQGFYQSNTYAGLSPANPVVSQWTHGHRDHGGEAGAEVWTQQQNPHSPRLLRASGRCLETNTAHLAWASAQGQPASGEG